MHQGHQVAFFSIEYFPSLNGITFFKKGMHEGVLKNSIANELEDK
jgi:hypothetical protein